MAEIRKPFEGVFNIIMFNWHLYLLSVGLILLIFLADKSFNEPFQTLGNAVICLIICITLLSLLVSFYVYDISDLYKLTWLNELKIAGGSKIVNINAGFDETSFLLKDKFPSTILSVFDFYNPDTHTEISIKRARKANLPFPDTIQISTSDIPLPNNYADDIFIILSAHEIRDEKERTIFFDELKRVLNPNGKIIVTEHLRNFPNFIAYNIGAFHFLPQSSWYRVFENTGLRISDKIKITPFITSFILEKYGSTT